MNFDNNVYRGEIFNRPKLDILAFECLSPEEAEKLKIFQKRKSRQQRSHSLVRKQQEEPVLRLGMLVNCLTPPIFMGPQV